MLLVTGGAGFIGSVLIRQLNEAGRDDIIVADNLACSEKWRNLVRARYADYLHRDQLRELVQGGRLPWRLEAVVHLGACSSTTERDADFLMRNNFHYSRDLCRCALEMGARVINASSAAVYGDGSLGFSDDPALTPRLRPRNMYGYSKQLFDLWLLREGLEGTVASLRFFNVYGPNEYHKGSMRSVVAKAFQQIREDGCLRLFRSELLGLADGEQKRDFVHVRDCAAVMLWLLQRPEVGGILNVGTGEARSFNDLARAVCSAMQCPCRVTYVEMPESLRGKYQNHTCADTSRLRAAGCPVRFAGLEDGVRDYVCNYLMRDDPWL